MPPVDLIERPKEISGSADAESTHVAIAAELARAVGVGEV